MKGLQIKRVYHWIPRRFKFPLILICLRVNDTVRKNITLAYSETHKTVEKEGQHLSNLIYILCRQKEITFTPNYKELNTWHKLVIFNLYFFASWGRKPLIFQMYAICINKIQNWNVKGQQNQVTKIWGFEDKNLWKVFSFFHPRLKS